MKTNILLKMINEFLMTLPTPASISYKWNYGFMLASCLGIQIVTGLFLTMHYTPHIEIAFSGVIEIMRNVNTGWWFRFIHSNGASLFFILMYLHVGRGIYYMSYKFTETWNIGVAIILISMMTAFLGYVLPWGQMSFWGATVITNLLSVVPYLKTSLVEWIWGGFSVSNPTLNRFYTFHYLAPFIVVILVLLHLMFLHETGSSNPGGVNSNLDKILFYPYFLWKDFFSFVMCITFFTIVIIQAPNVLGDPENFINANPLVTPPHIQPEWYLLFAYSILRSIPNKMGGVIALALSIMVFFTLPLIPKIPINTNTFMFLNKIMFWAFLLVIFMLTWLGACPVEEPFIFTGQIVTFFYFFYFPMNYMVSKFWASSF